MLNRIKNGVSRPFRKFWRAAKVLGRTKYFCIGRNKTGTTSIRKAFLDLGFVVGNQRAAELLVDPYYFAGNFKPLIKYCKTAQVFQDAPFSYPNTFKYLDEAFPQSKFILTVRNDAEQWYRSITRFHAKKFGNGSIPTIDDLHDATYVRRGWMYNVVRLHGTTDDDPYNKELMMAHYEHHNKSVIEYFRRRQKDLLVVNLAEQDAYQKFVDFVDVKSAFSDFPHENKT